MRRSGIVEEYLKVLTAFPSLMSSDFFVTVPNVLHAFCLTHDGASKVQEANVFPAVSGIMGWSGMGCKRGMGWDGMG